MSNRFTCKDIIYSRLDWLASSQQLWCGWRSGTKPDVTWWLCNHLIQPLVFFLHLFLQHRFYLQVRCPSWHPTKETHSTDSNKWPGLSSCTTELVREGTSVLMPALWCQYHTVHEPTSLTQPYISLGSLNEVPTLAGWGKRRIVTSARLHVSSCSIEADCKLLYSVYFTYFTCADN